MFDGDIGGLARRDRERDADKLVLACTSSSSP